MKTLTLYVVMYVTAFIIKAEKNSQRKGNEKFLMAFFHSFFSFISPLTFNGDF